MMEPFCGVSVRKEGAGKNATISRVFFFLNRFWMQYLFSPLCGPGSDSFELTLAWVKIDKDSKPGERTDSGHVARHVES